VRLGVVLVLLLAACERTPNRELDLDLIKVHGAHLATDTVGEGKFVEQATFVLVDAENTGGEGAYITLAGELIDAGGAATGTLAPQSLWIPSHDSRTFALVDSEHKPRPATKTARVKVRGANMSSPAPLVRIEELHSFDDHGHAVVQAYVVNDSNRIGLVMVIASFHDATDRPIQRPFQLVKIGPKHDGEPGNCLDADSRDDPQHSKCPIRFIGPAGSKTGTMFVGDIQY